MEVIIWFNLMIVAFPFALYPSAEVFFLVIIIKFGLRKGLATPEGSEPEVQHDAVFSNFYFSSPPRDCSLNLVRSSPSTVSGRWPFGFQISHIISTTAVCASRDRTLSHLVWAFLVNLKCTGSCVHFKVLYYAWLLLPLFYHWKAHKWRSAIRRNDLSSPAPSNIVVASNGGIFWWELSRREPFVSWSDIRKV